MYSVVVNNNWNNFEDRYSCGTLEEAKEIFRNEIAAYISDGDCTQIWLDNWNGMVQTGIRKIYFQIAEEDREEKDEI